MNLAQLKNYLQGVRDDVEKSAFSRTGYFKGRSFENFGVQVQAVNALLKTRKRDHRFTSDQPAEIAWEVALKSDTRQAFLKEIDAYLAEVQGVPAEIKLPREVERLVSFDELVDDYLFSRKINEDVIGTSETLAAKYRQKVDDFEEEVFELVKKELKRQVSSGVPEVEIIAVAKEATREVFGLTALSDSEIEANNLSRMFGKRMTIGISNAFEKIVQAAPNSSIGQEWRGKGRLAKSKFLSQARKEIDLDKGITDKERVVKAIVLQKNLSRLDHAAVSGAYEYEEMAGENVRAATYLTLCELAVDEKEIAEITEESVKKFEEEVKTLTKKGVSIDRIRALRIAKIKVLEVFLEKGIDLKQITNSMDLVEELAEDLVDPVGDLVIIKKDKPEKNLPKGVPTKTNLIDVASAKGGFSRTFLGFSFDEAKSHPYRYALTGGPVRSAMAFFLDASPGNIKTAIAWDVLGIYGSQIPPYFSEENTLGRLRKQGIKEGSAEWERITQSSEKMRGVIGEAEKIKRRFGPAYQAAKAYYAITDPFNYAKNVAFQDWSANRQFMGDFGVTFLQYFNSPQAISYLSGYLAKTVGKWGLVRLTEEMGWKNFGFGVVGPYGHKEFVFLPTYRLKENAKNFLYSKVWKPLKRSRVGKSIQDFVGGKLSKIGGALAAVGGIVGVIWQLRKPIRDFLLGAVGLFVVLLKQGLILAVSTLTGGLAGGIILAGVGFSSGPFGIILGPVGFIVGFAGGGAMGYGLGLLLQKVGGGIKGLFGGLGGVEGLGLGGTEGGLFPAKFAATGGFLSIATIGGTGIITVSTLWITSGAFMIPSEQELGYYGSEYFDVSKTAWINGQMVFDGELENSSLPQTINYKIRLDVKNKGEIKNIEIVDTITITKKSGAGGVETEKIEEYRWNYSSDAGLEGLLPGQTWSSNVYIVDTEPVNRFKDSLITNTARVKALVESDDGGEKVEEVIVSYDIRIGNSPLPRVADLALRMVNILNSCSGLPKSGGGVVVNSQSWPEAKECLEKGLQAVGYLGDKQRSRIISIYEGCIGAFGAMQCGCFARAASVVGSELPGKENSADYCVEETSGYVLRKDWENLGVGDFVVSSQGEAGHMAVVVKDKAYDLAEALGFGVDGDGEIYPLGVVQKRSAVPIYTLEQKYCGYLRKK